ncbi:hypothetical protein ES754_00860 [Psychrobacter frigidicola]|uniref:Lipoprotein n=1 Tax=Psychrobacter frigidicola TaxID=45611 RepID=A0A5C7A4K8_9GAMM|nr:hypothetical protein [Psychrobacter frigidicola]TXD97570.1 hypothetical protein ES754_00860 [Psychrobacter frigidicola]
MKKIIVITLISYCLTGCALATNLKDDASSFDYDQEGLDLPSGMFTYYKESKYPQPAIAYFAIGKFVLNNRCLLFQLDNKLYTPIFPAKYTKYKEGDTQIILEGKKIIIGETLEISAVPIERKYVGTFITKGQPQCLTENLISIERWNSN